MKKIGDLMSKNIFNEMAKKYDNEQRTELANVVASEIRGNINDSADKILLDYGCGTGLVGLQFSADFKKVIFSDISEEMLKVVDSKIEMSNINNAETKGTDFLSNVKADTIIVSLVLLHVSEYQELIKELSDRLNDQGQLLIVDFDKNEMIQHDKVHNGFTREEMHIALNGAGLNNVEIKTFYHGEKVFMNKDASMFIASSIK